MSYSSIKSAQTTCKPQGQKKSYFPAFSIHKLAFTRWARYFVELGHRLQATKLKFILMRAQ